MKVNSVFAKVYPPVKQ
nr:unnamed protein product [Callosobruchus chinensis]